MVATPSEYHCEIVVAAARAGKHILCEKPMAMNAAECDEMLAAVDRGGREAADRLHAAFRRGLRGGPSSGSTRGEIGRVVLVKSLTYGPSIPKPWMYDIRQSNGPLSEVNSHDIDTLRWFSGERVRGGVRHRRATTARPTPAQQYPDFYDNVVLSARMNNGMQGSICGAQGVQYGYDARCEILGEKGLITVGSLAAAAVIDPHRGRQHDADRAQLDGPVPGRLPRGGRGLRALHPRESAAARRRAATARRRSRWSTPATGRSRERRPVRLDEEGDAATMNGDGLMLAATYQQGGDFAVREVPRPEIGRDGLLLRVRAASICGTDVKIIRNGHRKLADGQRIVLGHEFIGTIEQVGARRDGLSRRAAGRRGAQRRLRPLRRLHPRPGQLLPAVHGLRHRPRRRACGLGRDSRAVRGPGQRRAAPGERVGPRGLAVGAVLVRGQRRARLADRTGRHGGHLRRRADRADAPDALPARGRRPADRGRSAGGSAAQRAANWAATWPSIPRKTTCRERIRRETEGRGADVVITACPVAEVQSQAVGLLAPYGRLCLFGGLPRGSGQRAAGHQRHSLRQLPGDRLDGRIGPGLSHRPAAARRETRRSDGA